jgi:uncharacterized protein (TIGR02231 family)
MKLNFALLLTAAFLSPTFVYADNIPADNSKIIAATVYTDRATVTRQATLSIPAGSHSVTFSNLPLTLLPDSLRAEGSALASVKFGAVIFKQVMAAEIAEPRTNELSAQLETLNDQKNVLNGEKTALEAKKLFLTTIGTQAALRTNENIAEINLKPEQWTSAAQTLYSSINDVMTASVAVDAKLRELDKQINKVQSELNLVGANQYSTYTVTVPLETPTSTQLTLDLSYQVTNASWNPIYDARVNTESSKLELIQYGAVRQNSGEDWKGVKLTLSTAQPQRGTSLPDLQPLWVDIYNPEAYGAGINSVGRIGSAMSNSAPASMAAEKMVMQDQAALPTPVMAELKKEAEFATATIETGGFVSEYKIPGPASIIADGTETKVMVGTFATDSTLQIHIKPQLSTDAFLVAKAKLKGDSPILPGAVSLFRDGAFVGKSNLPLLRPDEEHSLFFGADDQVSVKRKILKDERTEAGMILRDNIQERHFVTEIQNLHSKPVTIVVKESTPVGRNDKISTEILKDNTTEGFEKDSANIKGLLRWEFNLDSKAKKDLKLGWKVTWPKDTNLSGI